MRITVAVTGASGTVLAKRLIENLKGHEVSLIVTESARQVAQYEKVDLKAMEKRAANVYDGRDMLSPLASSSNRVDAMVVVPCSVKSLSAIANGYADSLVTRAAENVLKMGWKLIVVPRDTPLSLAAIENMGKLKTAGAIILPPIVGYYSEPKTVDDVTDFIVGKILDCLAIEHRLYRKWREDG